jgi:hypothetical protein
MTTQELADQYVEMIRAGRSPEIYDQFYSSEIICKEPEHAAAMGIPILTTGIAAVRDKSKARMETIAESHGAYCTEPVVSGDYFSVAMGREVTFKNGDRRKFDEIAVFGVKNNKIVSETFFY